MFIPIPGLAPPAETERAPGRTGTAQVPGGYGPGVPPASSGPPTPSFAVPPWTWVRPPAGTDFNESGIATIVSGAPAVPVPGASFQVPTGAVPVIRSLTFDVNNLAPTDELVFRLRANQSPVEGWAPIEIFPRNAATITLSFGPNETFIVLPEGCEIDVTAEVVVGANLDVGAAFHGWHVNVRLAEAAGIAYQRVG